MCCLFRICSGYKYEPNYESKLYLSAEESSDLTLMLLLKVFVQINEQTEVCVGLCVCVCVCLCVSVCVCLCMSVCV